MSVTIKGKEYTPAPEGTHHAVCVDVVDLGDVLTDWGTKPQVRVTWELEATMEDGRRFTASKRYGASLHSKSTLHKDLKSWRGKSFTADELREFDLEAVLGKPCQLVIQHNEVEGSTYANVAVILKADAVKKLIASGKYQRVKDRPDYKAPVKAVATDATPMTEEQQAAADDIPF